MIQWGDKPSLKTGWDGVKHGLTDVFPADDLFPGIVARPWRNHLQQFIEGPPPRRGTNSWPVWNTSPRLTRQPGFPLISLFSFWCRNACSRLLRLHGPVVFATLVGNNDQAAGDWNLPC